MNYDKKIAELQEQIVGLVLYMRQKIDMKDWHAVCDAANDIRELEAQIELLLDLI